MLTPVDIGVRIFAHHLARTGRQPDARPEVDTATLRQRRPHLAAVEITDAAIAGPHGGVPARQYRMPGQDARSALVWLHGGAFVSGDLDMPESNWVALELAAHGIPVLAVDYRKALRGVRHPVPSDDIRAAWLHATAHADELFGVDAARVHLGGASAGGAIVAGVTLRTRDEDGPAPASLLLAYPMLHPYLPPTTAATLALTKKLPARMRFRPSIVRAFAKHYAGRAGVRDPYAFPGVADDLHDWPPTYILVAMIDELRASGDLFAQQLRAAGASIVLFAERSATHGHLNYPEAASAQRSITRLAEWIDAH
ncbi:alpha/beta hydrolase fold domain-containing protein [Microbacterium kribbense]|uniref:Alpha/beta hydrolase fold domain-containing protein n=1 Tax=Microbacterium kribbense TaxID=433645 RepID=A0ABP7G7B3_9MICO